MFQIFGFDNFTGFKNDFYIWKRNKNCVYLYLLFDVQKLIWQSASLCVQWICLQASFATRCLFYSLEEWRQIQENVFWNQTSMLLPKLHVPVHITVDKSMKYLQSNYFITVNSSFWWFVCFWLLCYYGLYLSDSRGTSFLKVLCLF